MKVTLNTKQVEYVNEYNFKLREHSWIEQKPVNWGENRMVTGKLQR